MKILGRHVSNLWLLAIPALLAAGAPILLMLFLFGNNLVGAIVAAWSRPWNAPQREDLVGVYCESERRSDHVAFVSAVALDLRTDGSMRVQGLPMVGSNGCIMSGDGTWSGPGEEQKVELTLGAPSKEAVGYCKSGSDASLELSGHFKPYKLYWVVGDPDSGDGVWFARK